MFFGESEANNQIVLTGQGWMDGYFTNNYILTSEMGFCSGTVAK